jgi:hypothetical protein
LNVIYRGCSGGRCFPGHGLKEVRWRSSFCGVERIKAAIGAMLSKLV